MTKRGYIYTVDAVFGMLVLVIGPIMIAGMYYQSPEKDRTQAIAYDITGILSNVKVKDICSDVPACTCRYSSITTVCTDDHLITNPEMSLMELCGLLYNKSRRDRIELIINETIIDQEILPLNYRMQIILEDPGIQKTEQLFPMIIK